MRVAIPDGSVEVELSGAGGSALVWLQHGFARGPRHLQALRDGLLEHGLEVAAPALPSFSRPRRIDHAATLDAVTDAIAEHAGDRRLVLLGHSVGGTALSHAAARLVAAGSPPAALVLLDPNESLTGLMAPALSQLGDLPVRIAAAPPNRCNRRGEAVALLRAQRRGFFGVEVVGGTHCDAEGSADLVCRLACGAVRPRAAQVVRDAAVGWVQAAVGGDLAAADPIVLAWEAEDAVVPLIGEAA